MVKVLVIGASGYIGKSVAIAFARQGHETYGLIRQANQAPSLSKDEIIPIIGTATDFDSWAAVAEKVSVIVDTSYDYSDPIKHGNQVFDHVQKAAKSRKGGKLTFIYSSGWWVYRYNNSATFTEDDEPKAPAALGWRLELEQRVVKSNDLNGIVLRPANVYGKAGSLFGTFFSETNPVVYGDYTTAWSVVHVDDLADAYVLTAEKAASVGGHIFNIANKTSESVATIALASIRAAGTNATLEFKTPDEKQFLQVGLSSSGNAWSGKAEDLLGWRQKHPGVVDGIDGYFFSWKSYQQ